MLQICGKYQTVCKTNHRFLVRPHVTQTCFLLCFWFLVICFRCSVSLHGNIILTSTRVCCYGNIKLCTVCHSQYCKQGSFVNCSEMSSQDHLRIMTTRNSPKWQMNVPQKYDHNLAVPWVVLFVKYHLPIFPLMWPPLMPSLGLTWEAVPKQEKCNAMWGLFTTGSLTDELQEGTTVWRYLLCGALEWGGTPPPQKKKKKYA